MNENNQTPNQFPPMIPAASRIPDPQYLPLGEHPDDRSELGGLLGVIEAVLRHPRRVVFHLHQSGPERLIGALLALAIVCSLVYGVIVGSFSGGTQLWAAPMKIALGLLFSSFICLPSLYIFACLGGSQARLVECLGCWRDCWRWRRCCSSASRRWRGFSPSPRSPSREWACYTWHSGLCRWASARGFCSRGFATWRSGRRRGSTSGS